MGSNAIDESFTRACNNIVDMYNAAKEDDLSLNQCIAGARALLKEPSIPRYHRIKTLLLLASMVGDCDEALHYHDKAAIALAVFRSHQVKDATRSANIHAVLNGLEEPFQELREILEQKAAASLGEPDDSADDKSGDVEMSEKAEETMHTKQREQG